MLRAEWMYDVVSTRGNYIKNVLDGYLTYSSKQYRGVNYLREVAENIPNVIALPGGAYNFGSETDLSMFEITRELLAYLGRTGVVKDAPPRHNLWMDCGKATRHGVTFSNVLDGLKRCVDDYRLRRCTD
jgi:dTDP-4-dehydrorhamnose reductase